MCERFHAPNIRFVIKYLKYILIMYINELREVMVLIAYLSDKSAGSLCFASVINQIKTRSTRRPYKGNLN